MFLNKDCKGGIRADCVASDRCALSSCVGGGDAGHDSSWLLCLFQNKTPQTFLYASFFKVTLTFLSFSPLLISFFCCLPPAPPPFTLLSRKEIFSKKNKQSALDTRSVESHAPLPNLLPITIIYLFFRTFSLTPSYLPPPFFVFFFPVFIF